MWFYDSGWLRLRLGCGIGFDCCLMVVGVAIWLIVGFVFACGLCLFDLCFVWFGCCVCELRRVMFSLARSGWLYLVLRFTCWFRLNCLRVRCGCLVGYWF